MTNITRGLWTTLFCFLGSVFTFLYALLGARNWEVCYSLSLFSCLIYLWIFRKNFFSTASLFLVLSTVAITFPVVPYLFFDLDKIDFFYDSLYINSVGLFFFIGIAFLKSPVTGPSAPQTTFLKSADWDKFYGINRKIYLFTLPFVFLVISAAGAWGSFFNFEESGYDRIASMKGLGPLMIFSVLNVTSAYYWAVGLWMKNFKINSLMVIVLTLFLNGFTQGRGNLLYVFFASLLFYLALKQMNWKILILATLGGMLILLAKMTRSWGVASDYPWQLLFFMQFAGDFDSLNNCAALIEYTQAHDFFGFYHIWSNILVYVPRDLFPGKPHDIGTLYLDTYIFPGVYLGADGGTGLAFGFQGIWYAAAGLSSLVLGNILLGWCLSAIDQKFKRDLKIGKPTFVLFSYIMLIGQSVITYREGFYSFLNVAFYMGAYLVFYKLFSSLKRKNESLMSSRNLGAP